MDQATFEGLLADFQQQCSSAHNLPDLTALAGHPDAPVIVLIHGIGGNARHWADPVSIDASSTWLFDMNKQPSSGTQGIGSSPPYDEGSVTSWTTFLHDNGCNVITWSLTHPDDLIQPSVQEAADVLTDLEQRVFVPFAQDVATNGGDVPPLIILCHSRGGLVTRGALKQLGAGGVPHLRKVITLCTPHSGSYMPRLANDYNTALSNNLDLSSLAHNLPGPLRHMIGDHITPIFNELANRVREALLHTFGTLSQGPGFMELDPESDMMRSLVQDEQPLPGVQYYGFAGSRPAFIQFFLCEFGHTVHLLETASPWLVEQIAKIPGIGGNFGGLEELAQGDSAVGLSRSQWPAAFGAPHQVFPVNHMQALVDSPLQNAVLETIRA